MTRHCVCSLLLLALPCFAQPPVPEVTVTPCQAPVKVDGALNEECWQRAQALGDFHVLGAGNETADNTFAKVAYDQAFLYVGVRCLHAALAEVKPQHLQHDSAVHSDESIEVFVEPSGQGNPYFHYKLSCANVKAEQRATAAGARDMHWDAPWLSAVRQDAKGWTAEVALPLYVLLSYGDPAAMRLNLTRNAELPQRDKQAVIVSWRKQLTTWAPLQKTFHEPDLFGRVKGLNITKLQTPFLVSASDERLSPYRLAEGEYCYDVAVDLRGYNDRPGQAIVTVTDEPVNGKPQQVSRTVDIKGTALQTVTVPVAVELPVQRQTTVEVASASGGVFRRTRIAQSEALELIATFLDRTYYTTEAQATLVCTLGLPEQSLKQTTISLAFGGKVLARQVAPAARMKLTFPLKDVPVGLQKLRLQWVRNTGAPIFTQDIELAKRAPQPGFEWKVDRLNGVLLHDGKSFFPSGLLMAGIGTADEADLQKVADAGFNTVAHWTYAASPEDLGAYLDVAKKHGLMVLSRLEACEKRGVDRAILVKYFQGEALERVAKATRSSGLTNLKGLLISDPDLSALSREDKTALYFAHYEANAPVILESVRLAAARDNCLGHNQFDEPILSIFDQSVAGRDLTRRVNETDGYHPVFLLYSSYIPEGSNAVDWCDAIGTDPYWIPGGEPGRNSPNFVSKIVTATRQRAEGIHGMTWIVPVGELWSGMHKRVITRHEQYAQTYLALIHGAKAILYFRYPVVHRESWDALCVMAKQLQVLGPAAVMPDLPQDVTYEPGKFDPTKEEYPDVQVRLMRNPSGGTVLLAANSRPYPVETSYAVSSLGATRETGRLFGTERYAVQDGSFRDRMEAFGTRAYLLPEAARMVQIKVTMNPDDQGVAAEVQIPRTGRPDRKNLMPNPSFEEASLPGWPDYFRPWQATPLVGAPDAGWGQDADNPFEGKACLRITTGPKGYNGFYAYLCPQETRPTRYVFSIYLRAERDGMKAMLGGGFFPWQTVTLSTQWQRVQTSGLVPPRADRDSMIQLRLMEPGRIWADAVQVERGEDPTAFEP